MQGLEIFINISLLLLVIWQEVRFRLFLKNLKKVTAGKSEEKITISQSENTDFMHVIELRPSKDCCHVEDTDGCICLRCEECGRKF